MTATTTPRTAMPYPKPGQASAEAAFAEALNRMDALVPGAANSVGDTSPPGSPAEGDVYCLGASPTGTWSGQGGKVAIYVGGGWLYITPRTGWRVYAVDEAKDYRWSGSAWVVATDPITNCVKSGNATVASATWELMTFDTDAADDLGTHSTASNTGRIYGASGFTRMRLTFRPQFTSGNQTHGFAKILKNAAGVDDGGPTVGFGSSPPLYGNVVPYVDTGWMTGIASTDYFEAWLYVEGTNRVLIGPQPSNATVRGRTFFQAEYAP
jgi:hypothetical protein